MPLITGSSKAAFSSNVLAERSAGKPMAQSLAIAYSKKREAQRRRKGKVEPEQALAAGGQVEDDEEDDPASPEMGTEFSDFVDEDEESKKDRPSLARAWAAKRGR